MKKYVAFSHANGSHNSGIQPYNKALDWAKKHLGQHMACTEIHIAEVTSTVRRAESPIITTPYISIDEVDKAA